MKMLEKFFPNLNHLIAMLTDVRAVYDQFLSQPGLYKLTSVSVQGTLVGCLTEVCVWVSGVREGVGSHIPPTPQGIDFLDVLLEIFTQRKIDHEMVEDKIRKWLILLIQLVDITGPEPEVHFSLFIHGTQKVMKKYKHLTIKYVSDQLPM